MGVRDRRSMYVCWSIGVGYEGGGGEGKREKLRFNLRFLRDVPGGV